MYYSAYQEPEESIYRLLPEKYVQEKKPPMYRSRHNGKLAPSYSTLCTQGSNKLQANCHGNDVVDKAKLNSATMGRIGVHPSTEKFLLKKKGLGGGGGASMSELPTIKPLGDPARTAVPKRTDKPVMGLSTQKDFVISNAVDNIMMEPRKAPPPPVRYSQRPGFGKKPEYLTQIKDAIDTEYQMANEMHSHNTSASMRAMTEEERQALVTQLSDKWDEAHGQYLRMTFSLDTRHKVLRKEAVEAELEQIEKAIAKLSKKLIYVFPDMPQY